MESKVKDLMFILLLIEKSENTRYQMDCVLSNIGHYFTCYKDAEINATLLTLFQDKFNLTEKHEA